MGRGFDQGYRIRPVIPRHGLLGHWPVGEATEQRKKHHRVAGPNCSRAEPHFLDLALGPLYPQTLYHDSAALTSFDCRLVVESKRCCTWASGCHLFPGGPEKTSSWLHYTKPPEGRSSHRNQAHRNPTTMFLLHLTKHR